MLFVKYRNASNNNSVIHKETRKQNNMKYLLYCNLFILIDTVLKLIIYLTFIVVQSYLNPVEYNCIHHAIYAYIFVCSLFLYN